MTITCCPSLSRIDRSREDGQERDRTNMVRRLEKEISSSVIWNIIPINGHEPYLLTSPPSKRAAHALCVLAEVKRTKRFHNNRADSVERRTFQAAKSITWNIIPAIGQDARVLVRVAAFRMCCPIPRIPHTLPAGTLSTASRPRPIIRKRPSTTASCKAKKTAFLNKKRKWKYGGI